MKQRCHGSATFALRLVFLGLLGAAAGLCSGPAHAQTTTLLHDFHALDDGEQPATRMVQTADGTYYGTTSSGGSHSQGTIFKITPAGQFQTVYNFGDIPNDGNGPWGPLTVGPDGAIYGTTTGGGAHSAGAAFKFTTAGVESVLYSFGATPSDGTTPYSGLTYNSSDGNFYGTAQSGGSASALGCVFKLSTSGIGKVIRAFTTSTGYYPQSPLFLNPADGLLYGTTTQGGAANSQGTVFKVSTIGTLNIIKSLTSATGYAPSYSGVTAATDGTLYGTTSLGGTFNYGAIYKIVNGIFSLVYNFPGGPIGGYPQSSLVAAADGALYGSTIAGGDNQYGNIYKLQPGTQPAVTNQYSFTNTADGSSPGPLMQGSDGSLYGASYTGGVHGWGSVFKATTTGSLTTVMDLNRGLHDGTTPQARLCLASDGNFYGTTYTGGLYNLGTIYKMTPQGAVTILYNFGQDDNLGDGPSGGLVQAPDGTFYGTAIAGGPGTAGTLYKMTLSGSPVSATVTLLYGFDTIHGANPTGTLLIGSDGFLYGATMAGGTGAGAAGTLFKATTAGKLTVLKSFTGNLGTGPHCTIVQGPDGSLYGTTNAGGSYGYGTVFKSSTAGALLWTKPLTAATTGNPYEGLVFGSDGNLYGTGYQGGAGFGGIFRVTTNGLITNAFSFDGTGGYSPYAPLTMGLDGNLYGSTFLDAAANRGTLFRFTGNGITTLHNFDGVTGGNPDAALILGTDGNFYGAGAHGGKNEGGTVFKLDVDFPTIAGFSPTAAGIAANVAITGSNFATATSVTINGAAAAFTIVDDTHINAKVPAGAASTGNITVTTQSATATMGVFTVIPAPAITGLTPASGGIGASITIAGANFTGATAVKFNGKVSVFAVNSAAQITAKVPAGATTGKVTVTTGGGTATSATAFTVVSTLPPTVTSFAPASGSPSTLVTFSGSSFTVTTSVSFNGVSAAFTVNSATQITAVVPAGATTGPIQITNPGGSTSSATSFTVTAAAAPTITSFTPNSGPIGTVVLITGTNLTNIVSVRVNNIPASFTAISSTQIAAVVPASAQSGKITIKTTAGTATSSAAFTVVAAPSITSFSPPSGKVGSLVVVNGTNFAGISGVTVGGIDANYTVGSATQLTLVVPSGAATGAIKVSNAAGTATSATNYTVTP